ncbi:MAG TPA: glucuronate isomerase [Clostridiales bacterium]|nr:glucuronate isomerase [Clostridiales bacterium]
MKKFMDNDFLLSSDVAKEIFASCKDTPIFDWHCHLSPKEIYENETPRDIAQLWLAGDHYKWSAMRANGIEEKYITGDASPYEKFKAWASCMPYLLGNPLYHWTHLELQRYFNIYEPLSEKTCDMIWENANAQIKAGGFKPRDLIEKSNVYCVCTTDDAADTLEYHALIAKDRSFKTKVIPAFRPDKALGIELSGYIDWLKALEKVSNTKIDSYTTLKAVLLTRIELFEKMGCRATDHAFTRVPYARASEDELNAIFAKRVAGETLSESEIDAYKTELLRFFAKEYHKRNWGMEIHIGATRNNNTRMFEKLGPDTGFDAIADYEVSENLTKLLDSMDVEGFLPKTVLFTLNPKDNYVLSCICGRFQNDDAVCKMQFGSGWWFNDNLDGMREQLKAFANLSAIGRFVGMVTDSRSFLSYPRHEYFRRIFCEFMGEYVDKGMYPYDMEILSKMAQDVAFYNAKNYFNV